MPLRPRSWFFQRVLPGPAGRRNQKPENPLCKENEMETVLDKPTTPEAPTDLYKDALLAHVYDGGPEPTMEMVFDSGRVPSRHLERDIDVCQRRKEAARVLAEDVPRLEAAAREARKLAATVVPWPDRLVSDFRTIKELLAAADAARTVLLLPEQLRAREAAEEAALTKESALKYLRETCDSAIIEKINDLRGLCAGLMSGVESRSKIINADAAIARCRESLEWLSKQAATERINQQLRLSAVTERMKPYSVSR